MHKLPKLPTLDDKKLWETRLSIFHYPALTVSHQIGLFDALDEKPSRVDALAQKLQIRVRGATVLTNILWGLGFLECRNRVFSLSPTSKTFVRNERPFT